MSNVFDYFTSSVVIGSVIYEADVKDKELKIGTIIYDTFTETFVSISNGRELKSYDNHHPQSYTVFKPK